MNGPDLLCHKSSTLVNLLISYVVLVPIPVPGLYRESTLQLFLLITAVFLLAKSPDPFLPSNCRTPFIFLFHALSFPVFYVTYMVMLCEGFMCIRQNFQRRKREKIGLDRSENDGEEDWGYRLGGRGNQEW